MKKRTTNHTDDTNRAVDYETEGIRGLPFIRVICVIRG